MLIKITLAEIKQEAKNYKNENPHTKHTEVLNIISQKYGFEKYEILKSKANSNNIIVIHYEDKKGLRMIDLQNTIKQLKGIKIASMQMDNQINNLNKESYALLATAYIVGRSGWERTYVDTQEYYLFIESKQAHGEKINDKILDDEFLTKNKKREQINGTCQYELTSSDKIDGVYNHNWLSKKTNLISCIENGLVMMQEID